MAADLVESPHIKQTFVHDLESFFWVLLWVVLTLVKTNWDEAETSKCISTTFSPKVFETRKGVTGVNGKKDFLESSTRLNETTFEVPGNTPLTGLLIGLKSLFAAKYVQEPKRKIHEYDPDALDGKKSRTDLEHQIAVEDYNRRKGFLNGYVTILSQFKKAVTDTEWPDNDAASPQPRLQSISETYSSHSSTKRSRSVYEGDVLSSSKRRLT
jgi:hypothetical protein